MGKIIKKKYIEPGSLKRFSWSEAESHDKVDDHRRHGTLIPVGKIIKAKDIKPSSLKRLVLPDAENRPAVTVSGTGLTKTNRYRLGEK